MARDLEKYRQWVIRNRERINANARRSAAKPENKEKRKPKRKEWESKRSDAQKLKEAEYKHRWYLENSERLQIERHENYILNKEEIDEKNKKWTEANPEKSRAIKRKYYRKNSETIKKYHAQYRVENKDKLRIYRRRYNAENREHKAQYHSRRRRENLWLVRQISNRSAKKWYYKNIDKAQLAHRLWTIKNTDLVRDSAHLRRAREANATIKSIRPEFWAEAKAAWKGCCAYCGELCEKPEWDHFMPLARGGAHAEYNFVPACPRCNRRKHAKDPFVWLHDIRRSREP